MKKYLILSFFLIGITCAAQVKNFTFYGSANYPIIKTVETDQQITLPIPAATGYSSFVIPLGIRESYVSKVGFDIGSRFDYYITSKFFITSGISVNLIRFKRTVEVTTQVSPDIQFHNLPATVGQSFGSFYGSIAMRDVQGNVILNPPLVPQKSGDIGNTTTMALQVPLLMGTSFFQKKLEVRTGALFSYLLHATQTKEQYTASTQSISEYKDRNKDGFNEFQAGITVQTTYLFSRHIGIDFTLQKFFTPIYNSPEQSGGESKYNLLSLGLSYKL